MNTKMMVGLSIVAMVGCSNGGVSSTTIDLMGAYDDGFQAHTITATEWRQGSTMASIATLTVVDNEARFAVGQNAADHPYYPNLWSRFDWTWFEGELLYCQSAFNAESEPAALSASANANDPTGSGCGGFAWSRLAPAEAASIAGTYDDGFAAHTITETSWTQGTGESASVFVFTEVDNDAGFAIARNDDDNSFEPGRWSRFDWVERDGALYYCQTSFDARTAERARSAQADRSSPVDRGCGMFGWSALTPEN